MTRGRIAIITPEGDIITSTEFNGDMSFEGHGQDVYDYLECVDTVEEYKELVAKFNEENFHYNDELYYKCDESFLDMQCDCSAIGEPTECREATAEPTWLADYLYIKNLSEKPVVFNDAQGRKIELDTDTTAVFNFGEFIACCAEDFETSNFIEKLKEKKENLSYDDEENYADLWNMCSDYENDHRGIYLTDFIMEHDFVNEEDLEYIVKENATNISRLRCFINDTYDANLYRLDGYGNLANIENDDFESLIDDLVYQLEKNITVPLAKNQEACL